MDINGLHLFLAVVRTGSFSEAGRELSLVPSSVSRQITQLEKELGAHLFVRTTRSLRLTEAGHVFEARARQLLSDIEETRLAVRDLDHEPKGLLRVTAPMSLGRLHIARAVFEYMTRWPEIQVELDLSDQVVDLVERDIHVAIRIGTLNDSSMVARRLGGVRRFVYASPDYLEKAGIPETPEDLQQHTCLTFHPHGLSPLWRESAERWRFDQAGKRIEVPVAGTFKANTGEVIVQAALAGKGLMMMLDWIVVDHVAAGRLVPVLTDYTAAPYDGDAAAYAVYPAGRKAPAKVRTFVAHLQQYFVDNLRV